ncbi:hypothetical protein A3K62_01885 [Candidatus Pacearchaeota archaeon RBG_16_35_8]|nr:MAG: hypothetical protein A3K62_01885 [Candidatus Pacearchaeota archaeon RBG_16_35_8]
MDEKTPFRINYPINLLIPSRKINMEDGNERKKIFQKSLFYYKHDNEINPFLEQRSRTFIKLAKEVSALIGKKHPTFEILSVSLFGSSLFSKNPGDFDFLVIVKGNVFLLEETSLTVEEDGRSTDYAVGISIKGIDNLSQGILDLKSDIDVDKQTQVLDRTATALFKRHLPVLGYEFIENHKEFLENVYAHISDLLSNTYNLYYLKEERPNLSDQQRTRKILSRLYEGAIYLESIEKTKEASDFRKEIYLSLEEGNLSFPESKKIFDRFKSLYLKKSQAIRKEISEKISFKGDDSNMAEILQRTKEMISKKEIGEFLPVMAKIIDKNGNTIAFSKRTKEDTGPIHAEVNTIHDAEIKNKTDWENYTLYCSLEPCGNCAKKIAELGIKKVVYVLPDPLLAHYGRQRESYENKGILFYKHHNSALTAEFQKIYEGLYAKEILKIKKLDALNVLSDERLKRNIVERLKEYWKYMKLPYEWVSPILDILSEYNYDEEFAIKEVRRKFPSLTDKNSQDYGKKIILWRKTKIENLARRIKEYIHGGVLCDIGGRQEDFIEEIIKLNPSVRKAYVTDIESFSKGSKNHKITFVVQPSATKLPFKEKIDTIIFSMMLHHLNDRDQKELIKNAISSLNKDGLIILIEDTYPEKIDYKEEKTIKEFLGFNSKEKEKILSFYDWFGNRLMRNRDNIPMEFNYKTMEEWTKFFEEYGVEQINSEFIKKNQQNPDLFPPKAIIVFKKKDEQI